MSRRAFTLPELLLSLLLMSVVSTAIVRLTIHVIQSNRSENERVQITANLRSALLYLQREFRPLDATDPLGSDIIQADESAVVYRSMQSLYTVCGLSGLSQMEIVVRRAPNIDLPLLGGIGDSLLVFLERDEATMREAGWVRAGVVAYGARGTCVDGSPGDRAVLGGLPARDFHHITPGAPVRKFVLRWLRLYQDGQGLWWLGERTWNPPNGWSRTQPIVGPFTSDGVRFTYLDRSGVPTTQPSAVARIGVKLVGVAAHGRSVGDRVGVRPSDILESEVALRNNAR